MKNTRIFEIEKLWSKRDQLPCDFAIFDIFIQILDFGNFLKKVGIFLKKDIIYLVILKEKMTRPYHFKKFEFPKRIPL